MASTILTKSNFSIQQRKAAAIFWTHVDITANPDECWEWLLNRDRKGYGRLCFPLHKWITQRAHRIAYFLAHTEMPQLHVLHSCDNPPCCNPKHLREGTQAENIKEASMKGRMTRPDRTPPIPIRKLSDSQVRIIKIRLQDGERRPVLAREFNVTTSSIRQIDIGHTWRHIQV